MRDGNSTIPDGPADASNAEPGSGIVGEPGAVHVIVGTDATRIVLSGEVDADLGAELQEATAEAEQVGLPIEVDAHHVTFMDSSGVAFLARLSIRSKHRVRLLRVPPTGWNCDSSPSTTSSSSPIRVTSSRNRTVGDGQG